MCERCTCLHICVYRSISSVKGELVPHLVRHQWMQASFDGSNGAGSANKQGWLFLQRAGIIVLCPALQVHASSCVDVTEQLALQLSSFAGYSGQSETLTAPLLACHALEVCEQLCVRVNSIASYMDVNRLVRWQTLICCIILFFIHCSVPFRA